MDNDALAGKILLPDPEALLRVAQSLTLARRISRALPPADLQHLLHGAIGEAVAEAASYADATIFVTTLAAYLQA